MQEFVAGNPTAVTTSRYRYDGIGRRIGKVANGQTKRYIYDGEDILPEYEGANVSQARTSLSISPRDEGSPKPAAYSSFTRPWFLGETLLAQLEDVTGRFADLFNHHQGRCRSSAHDQGEAETRAQACARSDPLYRSHRVTRLSVPSLPRSFRHSDLDVYRRLAQRAAFTGRGFLPREVRCAFDCSRAGEALRYWDLYPRGSILRARSRLRLVIKIVPPKSKPRTQP